MDGIIEGLERASCVVDCTTDISDIRDMIDEETKAIKEALSKYKGA